MPAKVHSGFARAEDFLGKMVEVTVDRPLGTRHLRHPAIVYSVNYGYVPYVLGVEEPLREFRGRCAGIVRRPL